MSTSLITHLRPGIFPTIPSIGKADGAWLFKQTPTIDGLIVDERRGLGDDRLEQPGRALDLNGTNQYGRIPIDPVSAYPFAVFGWHRSSDTTLRGLVSIAATSTASNYLTLRVDNGDRAEVLRTGTVVNGAAIANMPDQWSSFVCVFTSETAAQIYRNGLLVVNLEGMSSIPLDSTYNTFVFGARRVLSASDLMLGKVHHVGFLRRAATPQDAIDFHNTGIISDAEVLLPLDDNSTAVAYNIGSSSATNPEATLVNGTVGMLYKGNDVSFSRQSEVGYSPRRNLFNKTEELSHTNWVKSQASVVGDKLIPSVAFGAHYIYQNITVVSGQSYMLIVEAKADGYNFFGTYSLGFGVKGWNLSTGTAPAGGTIEALGDGWYKCKLPFVADSSGTFTARLDCFLAANAPPFNGDGTSGILLRKPRFFEGVEEFEYQRIGADPGTNVLFPALLSDPTKSVATDTLEFQGQAPRNLQAQDAPCLQLNGTNQNVLMDLGTVAGPELVANGDFGNGATGWALGAGWSVSGGVASGVGTGSITYISQNGVFPNLTTPCLITFTVTERTGIGSGTLFGTPTVTGLGDVLLSPRTYSIVSFSRVTNNFGFYVNNTGHTMSIDNVSVRQLPLPLVEKLGPELVTNGGFDDGTAWTPGTGWTISGGVAQHSGAAGSNCSQDPVLVSGKRYKVTISVSSLTGAYSVRAGSVTSSNQGSLANGQNTFYLTANGTLLNLRCDVNGTVTVDNISVKEVAQIDSEGTSILSYLSNGTGFTGTSGTAWDIRFNGVTRFPCNESAGTNIYDIVGNVACGISNPASNWSTQDSYFYGLRYGFSDPKEQLGPERATNPTQVVTFTSASNGTSTPITNNLGGVGSADDNKWFELQFEITSIFAGSVSARIKTGSDGPQFNSVGVHKWIAKSAAGISTTIRTHGASTTATITNFTIKKLPAHPDAQIPASATNITFDANGGVNALTHPAGSFQNLASCEIVAAQPDSVWTFGRDIPGVDSYDPWDAATDGISGLGDITAKLNHPKKIGKLKLPKV